MGALFGGWIGQHYDGTIAPFSNGFAVLGIVGLLIVLATERGRLFGVGG
jgi:DHA1 family bicyclomycin/chloramphenicol resistance-like MFS transporter